MALSDDEPTLKAKSRKDNLSSASPSLVAAQKHVRISVGNITTDKKKSVGYVKDFAETNQSWHGRKSGRCSIFNKTGNNFGDAQEIDVDLRPNYSSQKPIVREPLAMPTNYEERHKFYRNSGLILHKGSFLHAPGTEALIRKYNGQMQLYDKKTELKNIEERKHMNHEKLSRKINMRSENYKLNSELLE